MVKVDEQLSRQALRSAIWYTVAKIVEEEELALGLTISEHFVAALSDMVYTQALSLGKDLESFAKHAGRSTVNVEDVKLVSRRNEHLYEMISSEATKHGLSLNDLKIETSKPKAKPKPRVSAALKVPKPKAEPKPRAKKLIEPKVVKAVKGKGKGKAVQRDDSGSDGSDVEVIDLEGSSGEEEEEVALDSDDEPVRKRSKGNK